MIYFPNKTLERYTLTINSTDIYDAPTKEYVYTDTVTLDFQESNNQQIAEAYGVELQNLYKAYLDSTTEFNDSDILYDPTLHRTYRVLGNVQIYTHFHNYKKLNLVLEREDATLLTKPEQEVEEVEEPNVPSEPAPSEPTNTTEEP